MSDSDSSDYDDSYDSYDDGDTSGTSSPSSSSSSSSVAPGLANYHQAKAELFPGSNFYRDDVFLLPLLPFTIFSS